MASIPFSGTVELTSRFEVRPEITHVLFDFDGTLSLIRQGWPEVMVPMFVEMLPRRAGDTEEALAKMMFEDIMRLNGKQTIYQMIQFAERVRERGGNAREPLWYKNEYLARLQKRIQHRIDDIRNRRTDPDTYLVHGARPVLEYLKEKGLNLFLASGTDERFVREEVALLGLTEYFHPHIHGALDDYKLFSKKMVIERMIRDYGIQGAHLLSFGDGYVEIENTVEAGGLAIAVASDEANNGSGRMDAWKRERLLGVGAAVVIPDFRDGIALVNRVLGVSEDEGPTRR